MLAVPDIFFEAPWPAEGSRVDMLAIDRAGMGDVHVVEIKKSIDEALSAAEGILEVPAQFRWVAFFDPQEHLKSAARKANRASLFAAAGMGRIGVIQVYEDENEFGDLLKAAVIVRAERFAGSLFEDAQRFGKSHKPDILVR